jgi:hypothetical protein
MPPAIQFAGGIFAFERFNDVEVIRPDYPRYARKTNFAEDWNSMRN